MENNTGSVVIESIDELNIQTDKELLEDFLNSLDQSDDKVTDIESITPEIRLDKFLWVIKLKEAELEKCKDLANESITKTQNWLNSKEQKICSTIEYLSGQMRNYLKSQKLKTLSLPMGTIGFRKQPDTLEIIDESAFFENALPELIRHIPESFTPDLKAIKEHIKLTGDLPDGIEIKTKDEKFYYKLKTD